MHMPFLGNKYLTDTTLLIIWTYLVKHLKFADHVIIALDHLILLGILFFILLADTDVVLILEHVSAVL